MFSVLLLSAIDDTGVCSKQRKLHNLGNVVLLLLLPVTISDFCKGRRFAFSHKLDASTAVFDLATTLWIPYEPLQYLALISNVLSTYAPICAHLYWCSERHISIIRPSQFTPNLGSQFSTTRLLFQSCHSSRVSTPCMEDFGLYLAPCQASCRSILCIVRRVNRRSCCEDLISNHRTTSSLVCSVPAAGLPQLM